MRNEHELSPSPESSSPPPPQPPADSSWDASFLKGRFFAAVLVCALIIGAALAYDILG